MDHSKIVINYKDYQIYQDQIDSITEDYINSLPKPDSIYNSATFTGLLNCIYNELVKPFIDYDKAIRNSPNRFNYELLDLVFNNIYIPLCTQYSIIPTLLMFCVFVKMSRDVISDYRRGAYGDGDKLHPDKTNTIKNWDAVCESALYSRTAQSNSVGSMFILKSVYQYQEQPQQVEFIPARIASAAEIEEKYKDNAKPELIDNSSG